MSYIDISLTNEYIFFELIDHQTGIPLVNPQFPIGIGMNFGTLYDLGCGIRIHELLSEYHLSFSDVLSATLYLYGTNSVGDMDVYSTSGAISDSPITPTNFNYEIPIEDTYDSTYCGYLFKMSTLSAISYSTFINTGSYIRIEFYDNTSIYVSSLPTKRNYFYGEQLDLTGLKIKFIKNDSTEVEIFNYTSTPLNNAYLYPTNNTVTFYYALGDAIKTCSIQINVDNSKEDILYDTSALDGSGNEMHDFDIHMPSTPPPQNGFPVVVTIHGGDFTGGNKEDYDYIEPFLNSNGCIHVNMNYRVIIGTHQPTNSYYDDMLDDINALINYLYNNASRYHIDTSKIALMGYSAGGNLALCYALRSKIAYSGINSAIPIELIITEGAVTFSELTVDENVIKTIEGAYLQNPNIDSITRTLLCLSGYVSLNDIAIIKPENYQSALNDLLFLIVQGTGYNYGGTSTGDGDMVVPLCDAEALFNQNLIANRYSSDYPIFVINYCKHWSDNPTDTSYRTAISQSHTSGYYMAFNNIITAYKNISNNNNS
ncbi:alpha/beta hydrolase [bacterium]|nr:alpha/beta hydrolase [bacterium]